MNDLFSYFFKLDHPHTIWGYLHNMLLYFGFAVLMYSIEFVVIIYAIYYIFYHRKHKLIDRKIQLHAPNPSAIKNDIVHNWLTLLIIALLMSFTYVLLIPYSLIYYHVSDHSIVYYLFTFPLVLFIHDTYFYWLHRIFHHPSLFKKCHVQHHRSTNPTPLTSLSFDLIEGVLEFAFIPMVIFIIPMHTSMFNICIGMFMLYNIYAHLGYELFPSWLLETKWGKWINTSVAHNMHHRYFNCNYSYYFMFWDRMMGTVHPKYEEHWNRVFNSNNNLKQENISNSSILLKKGA